MQRRRRGRGWERGWRGALAGCALGLAAGLGAPGGAGAQPVEIIGPEGDGAGNLLELPWGLDVDSNGNVYVAGANSHNVFRITPEGLVTQVIDASGDGDGNPLDAAWRLVVDANDDAIVAGFTSSNVFRITPTGDITEIIGPEGDGSSDLDYREGGALFARGNVYVPGRFSSNVFRITPDNVITEIIDETGDGSGQSLERPQDIHVDSNGNAYVGTEQSDRLFRVTPEGAISELFHDSPFQFRPGSFAYPKFIEIDGSDNVYVAGSYSDNAFRITPEGVISEIIDDTGDGAGNALSAPWGIAVDSGENVYVTGVGSHNVFCITPAGEITEILSAQGDGAGNLLNGPRGLLLDASGNLFVVAGNDESSNVFRITPGGEITELIDSLGDGAGNTLDYPQALAADRDGRIYATGVGSDNVFDITPLHVTDGFDLAGSGRGWLAGSAWGASLSPATTYPVDPESRRHLHTGPGAYSGEFRTLYYRDIARIDTLSEVWIAFDMRLEQRKQANQYAGVSMFAGGQEEFFLGAPFVPLNWGASAFNGPELIGSVPAGAEWARLMAHLDFVTPKLDLYVDGVLQGSGGGLPDRGWDSVRIASGNQPGYIDRLRIGTSRASVEVPERPRFVAGGLDTLDVWYLDERRQLDSFVGTSSPLGNNIGGVAVGSGEVAGVQSDAWIFAGTWEGDVGSPPKILVINTDLFEVPFIHHDYARPGYTTGLAWVAGKLAVKTEGVSAIEYVDPFTGSSLGSIPHACADSSDAQGLTYDGSHLWVSCTTHLEKLDPETGALVASIVNASSGCPAGGTAIAASAPGELTLGCVNDEWFRVASSDGATIDSGSGAGSVLALTFLPEPGAAWSLVASAALLARLRRTRVRRAGARAGRRPLPGAL